MKKSYFSEMGVWLKGNIHSHSTVSDGRFSPEELARGYQAKGYDFLAITDHNVLVPHDDLANDGFLLLTGTEQDLAYSPDKCIHVVGLAQAEKTKTDYPCRKYSQAELTDQQLIDQMVLDGQFVSIAHPVWSRMTWEELVNLKNFHAIEVYNNGTEKLCHAGDGETLWEMLLRTGKHILATAVDDVHGARDLYGGWVCVKAAATSKEAVLEALHSGNYYASSGPVIRDFGLVDGKAYMQCEDCREIHFVTYPPRGKSFFAQDGESLTEATCPLTGREEYVRAVVVDKEGRKAWTNPIFFGSKDF